MRGVQPGPSFFFSFFLLYLLQTNAWEIIFVKTFRKKSAGLVLALFLAVSILAGCQPKYEEYRGTFITVEGVEVFNTVFTVLAWEKSDDDWQKHYAKIQELVLRYHKLFDYFHEYEGMNNILTINKNAGKAPVKVDQEIIDLLKMTKDLYDRTGEKTNVAMGSVTEIWHVVREHNTSTDGITVPEEEMILPSLEELQEAGEHTDFQKVIIDEAASTVYLEDPDMRLDVGAVAKGFATELVADALKEMGMENGLMSSGGNIKSIGAPNLPEKKDWGVGITDPLNPQQTLQGKVLRLTGEESVVSSGDYERYFTYEGKRYHHLIDPITFMPGENFAQVTVITEDSGLADFLSTTIFLLPYEEGKQVAEDLDVGVVWIEKDGTQILNEKAESLIRK